MLVIVGLNVIYFAAGDNPEHREYRVEASRVAAELEEKRPEEIAYSKYPSIRNVHEYQVGETVNHDYVLEQVNGKLYCIEYEAAVNYTGVIFMNVGLGAMLVVTGILFLYLNRKVLKPFDSMSNLSYELAKGNLVKPVKEEKSKYFGRFLWGMDMLRETLHSNREKELELQKEKKTLILSLSHDIKTPLSAIQLYTKALSGNLYDTPDKQKEALEGIARNAKQIEGFVSEIVTASREDFLNLEVNNGEFYLNEVLNEVQDYYGNQFQLTHTELICEKAENCLVRGDQNRVIEVLQNIMENAIKYGDGKRVTISIQEEEDCKLIGISNTGCELKEEELPHLFDSFYRGSNSEGKKGSGLGLYICKRLMKMMDGDIYVTARENTFEAVVVARKA